MNTFPAIHLKKMGWMDIFVKFSSELTVISLALLVAGMNLIFMGGGKNFSDRSFSAKLLSYHTGQDPKYYAKLTSISTVVVSDGSFFTPPADAFSGLTDQADADTADSVGAPTDTPVDYISSDGSLVKEQLSTSDLLAKQVKVYETQPGDTLSSIAAENGISSQTIIWANNLPDTNINPGWYLLIPPVDGTIVKADSNTTLPDIANEFNPEKYNGNKQVKEDAAAALLDTIISYNGLADAQDITPGQIIIVPGGVIAQPPQAAPKPKVKTAPIPYTSKIDVVTSIGDGYDGTTHTFPKGYCTYYVASRMTITFGGNAINWLANAKASGYVTGTDPAPHSAVVMTGPTGAMRRYGHVAYVESVNDNGTITITEMNYDHFNRVDTRTISIHDSSIRGYIYP